MDKKLDLSELKKLEGLGVHSLVLDDLENVSGGTDLSPAVIMYAKQLIQQFKNQGYTRDQLIEELKNRGISEEYWPMILEFWDSLS